MFQPTLDSVKTHQVPDWFHDAKLGIFIHWGLYSVPGWAPLTGELGHTIAEGNWAHWFANNPYAEWYQNSLAVGAAIGHGATYDHHVKIYGADLKYDDFAPWFNKAVLAFDVSALADAIKRAGARYAVLTTKHHEGFLLWPSAHPNPIKRNWQLNRDVVGELTDAVRVRSLRMGLYYSGGLDWTFNPHAIKDISDLFLGVPQTPEYAAYADAHWRELIARYEPSAMWNDIAYPTVANLTQLFADYYNAVPEGVINDRFIQARPEDLKDKIASADSPLPTPAHYDFRTPEYTIVPDITPHKWESCRGLGFSFGYNQNDTDANMLSVEELVRSFVDIVSKNGNLLLNVGPMADGSLPDNQLKRLQGLGDWLAVNGEAIYDTRPWTHAEGKARAGDQTISTRFTRKGDVLYVTLLGTPESREVILEAVAAPSSATITLLGSDATLAWEQRGEHLAVTLPEHVKSSPAHAIRISHV